MNDFELQTLIEIWSLPETPEPPHVALWLRLEREGIDPRTATWGDIWDA